MRKPAPFKTKLKPIKYRGIKITIIKSVYRSRGNKVFNNVSYTYYLGEIPFNEGGDNKEQTIRLAKNRINSGRY